MDKYRPKYCIETRFEKTIKFKEGDIRHYHYEQPVEYCNGVCYWSYDETSYERKHWGSLYWESKWFNDSLNISRYNEKIWTDKNAMDKAFEIIFNKKADNDGVYTPMKDFEIWLMCKGYEMISFDKMCSQSPCVCIVGEKIEGNKIYNPKSFAYTRFYNNKETNKTIYFGFGIQSDNLKFNFYFVHSDNMHLNYQTPIKVEEFEKAENCQLKSFQELDYEIRKEKKVAIT